MMTFFRNLLIVAVCLGMIACKESTNENGDITNELNVDDVFVRTLAGTPFYLVRKNDHYLAYDYNDELGCYSTTKYTDVSSSGTSIHVADPGGEVFEFVLDFDGSLLVKYDSARRFSFYDFINEAESDISNTPLCGNPAATGEVTVELSFQGNLPASIVRDNIHTYIWRVDMDVDNSGTFTSGDIRLQVDSLYGKDIEGSSTINAIGAQLFIIRNNSNPAAAPIASELGFIDLDVVDNRLIMTTKKSRHSLLESVTSQTQLQAYAFNGNIGSYYDYLPAADFYTSVVDNSLVTDPVGDVQRGIITRVDHTAEMFFIDFTSVNVTITQ